MGLQDRSYYQDSYSNPWGESTFSGGGSRSIITTLIIINVAIFILDIFTPAVGEHAHWLSQFMALKPAQLWEAPWMAWQFLTYGFAHASVNSNEAFFHVGGNMLVLFFLGKPIEQKLGRQEFLKYYLAALLVSGFAFFLIKMNTGASVVGASGAVSAVVALFIFFYPKSTLLVFGVFPVPTWIFGVFIVGMDLLRSMNPESAIAWEAHLAGFAFGFAYYYWKLNFNWIDLARLKKTFSGQPRLKIHKPSQLEKMRREVDSILEKINQQGEQSLSHKERRLLKKYSERLRKDRVGSDS